MLFFLSGTFSAANSSSSLRLAASVRYCALEVTVDFKVEPSAVLN